MCIYIPNCIDSVPKEVSKLNTNRIISVGTTSTRTLETIMNIHHDNCTKDNFKKTIGFYPSEECKDESIKYITRVWEQVSETFKDYDEKLVFEILNEPRLQDAGEHEWNYNSSCSTCKDAMNSLNEFNQNALDTIRASGGNNSTKKKNADYNSVYEDALKMKTSDDINYAYKDIVAYILNQGLTEEQEYQMIGSLGLLEFM